MIADQKTQQGLLATSEPGIRGLHSGFLRSASRFPDRPALEVAGEVLTYGELERRARALAATLERRSPAKDPPLTAVFAHRTATAYAGILAALFRGTGYVPLNRRFPPDRTRTMLLRSGCRAVVVDDESAEQLDEVLSGVTDSLLLVFPEREDVRELAERWPSHTIVGAEALELDGSWQPVSVAPETIAYVLFTSGSTGVPKGVMVSHGNVTAFVDAMVERYGITEEDRFSNATDLTLDLSVFDMFVPWERGACVCCLSSNEAIKPGRFIRDARLTVWFSVPSTGVFMRRLGALKPGQYPRLRWSLFCGEPLPVEVAQAWAEAAPNSTVENLYGPTELTVACTHYRWDAERSPAESHHGVVPIGDPYPGMAVRVADEELREVAPGEDGELLMTGPQLTLGYWRDPERTAAAFVTPPGEDRVFYRTGDRVRGAVDGRPMVYLGRIDHQIKILGVRVELGEVEAVVREESGVDAVIAVGWPRTVSGAGGIVAFVGDPGVDAETLRSRVAARLPEWMVPRQFRLLEQLPLNANGKFDRKALLESLEAAS